ncbi:BON domain-containing protein [Ectothiorhodospiraceae bacterium WFHF3C12]|nr:BON domain-containing protein [Ectothiorhodospiraceae bacterium WFHF3C12]
MADEQVVKSIRAALERDPEVNLHESPISVRLRDGLVEISGTADNIAIKKHALRIAQSRANGATVLDHVRLAIGEPREDAALRQGVLKHLTQESAFHGLALVEGDGPPDGHEGDWIAVDAGDGIVHLRGRVNSLSHRRLAEVLAWWTGGTADVDNRIHVEPPEQDTDAEIMDAIRIVFDKEPSIDPEQVRAECRGRVVTLQGAVTSEENRRLAAYNCWYIPGVHEVRNELRVT